MITIGHDDGGHSSSSGVGVALRIEPGHLPAPPARHTFVDHQKVHDDWARFGIDVPLEIIDSPYRELTAPVSRYLDRLEARWDSDRITVVIPEFVVGLKSITNVLHGQNALGLKLALLERPNTAVLSVPFHLHAPASSPDRVPRRSGTRPAEARTGLTAPLHALDQARLRSRLATLRGVGGLAIADLPERVPVEVNGEVTGTRVVPSRGSPRLEVTVDDGTASVTIVFTGRERILGIEPGRAVTFRGVIRSEHGRRLVLHPLYTLR